MNCQLRKCVYVCNSDMSVYTTKKGTDLYVPINQQTQEVKLVPISSPF